MRYQKSDIPDYHTKCIRSSCVYIKEGICDDPRTNKDNGDADCHKLTNVQLILAWLGK